MKQNLTVLFCGLLFGFGLGFSGMTDRARVPGFLDFSGTWDPTLLIVLGGAVGVTIITFRFILRRPHPIFANQFHMPIYKDIDFRLVMGSTIFGVGWALAGWCPAPGITAITLGSVDALIFVVAMALGSYGYRWWSSQRRPRKAAPVQQPASLGS